ncbi:MAG: glycosyltransferase family 2 protein, partial [Rhodospirillales bacterium]
MPDPKVSIIIRTRNEESWVGHCLEMVFKQDYPDFEVIIVDNDSRDHTLHVVKRFPIKEVVRIGDYLPGLALNLGIEKAAGQFITCLSSHCIPQNGNWLTSLIANFDDDAVAGVYGRQLPLAYSANTDKRDLLTVFGLDRRVQTRDYFFHNANSMVRREVLDKFPFDATVANLEDRMWGKQVTEAGYKLVYEPSAAVYHHHGINQDNDADRANGVSMVLDKVEEEIANTLPESLRPENCNVAAVTPVLGDMRTLQGRDLLGEMLGHLRENRYVRNIYAFSENGAVGEAAQSAGASFIERPDDLMSGEATLTDVLKYSLAEIEKRGDYPQVILYANYLYPFRPPNLFDELIVELQYKGLDCVFPGFVDYNDHWMNTTEGELQRV